MIKAARGLKKTGPRGQDAGGNGSPRPRRVTIAVTSLAPPAGEVKWTPEPSLRDTRDGHPDWLVLPRVLRDLPLSSRLLFAAFAAMCDRRGELQASTRTLAEYAGLSEAQVRRALKRLVAVRLVEVVASGHGRVATTYKLRWRTRTFPQRFASPSSKDFTSERKRSKSILSDASPSVKTQPLRLGRPVTEQGRRWALGHIRRELMGWGVPGKARGELMAGLANALTRAIKARRIRTGRELGKAVRLILAQLDEGELRASRLAGRDPRSLYSGAAMLVTQAVAEVEADRRTEEATEAILDRIRRMKAEARRAWTVQVTNVPSDCANTDSIATIEHEQESQNAWDYACGSGIPLTTRHL